MKRLLFIVIALSFILVSQPRPVYAAADATVEFQEAVGSTVSNGNVNLNFQAYKTNEQGVMVYSALSILGGLPQADPTGAMNPDGTTKVVYSRGLMGDMGRSIAMLYEYKPADTGLYVADLMHSAGIAQPAYAQGLGFASLSPILDTWKTFRNVAYFFFVVIFLLIGFLIMLRQKVGGQTVVTAQQAIPHVIVSLLFVTFSYAIAGLLIDLMYLFMFLILGLFGKLPGDFIGMNFLQLGFKMMSSGAGSAYEVVSAFSKSAEVSLGTFGSDVVGFISGVSMMVIVAIAIALNVFRLFFELLKTYVTIILNIVFAPILLMMGAIPGKNVFGAWIKNLVGNLAAFPTVLMVLIVFDELTGGISNNPDLVGKIESGGFNPPYLFQGFIDGGVAGALSFAVGLGALLIMPELVKKVKETMGAKGGMFEQLAGDVGKNLKAGWSGGELIPGLAMTNTAKWPAGGVSGKNILGKAAFGTSETRAEHKKEHYKGGFLREGIMGGLGREAGKVGGVPIRAIQRTRQSSELTAKAQNAANTQNQLKQEQQRTI